MDWMVYISAFSIKARTDESESYLVFIIHAYDMPNLPQQQI